jgi:hypothetical protein
VVGDVRRAHDRTALQGMPAHVTVLYPFRPLGRIDDGTLLQLERLIAGHPALELSFSAIGRFSGVRWLAPEPRAPIDRLTQALVAAFPDCPPYRGKLPDPTPHLTFALGRETTLGAVEAEMQARLQAPIRARIDSCRLFRFTDDRWQEAARFGFGA